MVHNNNCVTVWNECQVSLQAAVSIPGMGCSVHMGPLGIVIVLSGLVVLCVFSELKYFSYCKYCISFDFINVTHHQCLDIMKFIS